MAGGGRDTCYDWFGVFPPGSSVTLPRRPEGSAYADLWPPDGTADDILVRSLELVDASHLDSYRAFLRAYPERGAPATGDYTYRATRLIYNAP